MAAAAKRFWSSDILQWRWVLLISVRLKEDFRVLPIRTLKDSNRQTIFAARLSLALSLSSQAKFPSPYLRTHCFFAPYFCYSVILMSRARYTPDPSDPFENPSTPLYNQRETSPLGDIPPSPTGSESPLPDARLLPKFISSPLNPHTSNPPTSDRSNSGSLSRANPPSWGHGQDRSGSLEPSTSDNSSSGSHVEREHLKGIMAGNVGGGFSPYPVSVSRLQTYPWVWSLTVPRLCFDPQTPPDLPRWSQEVLVAPLVSHLHVSQPHPVWAQCCLSCLIPNMHSPLQLSSLISPTPTFEPVSSQLINMAPTNDLAVQQMTTIFFMSQASETLKSEVSLGAV